MLEEASNLRRRGSVTEADGPVRGVLGGGRSVGAKTLLRRFSTIAKPVVRNRLIIIIR